MSPTPERSARALFALLLGVALLAFAARVLPEPRTIDDAFITFRYSRNIVEGHGFVYNLGARTLGTTTPFYTLLMAALGAVSGSDQYPRFALLVNALADAGTAVLLAYVMKRVTGSLVPAAVAGGVWALNPLSVTFAIGGMETSVALFWTMAAVTLFVMGRTRAMAVCAALGILTRIDAVLWVGPLLFAQWATYWHSVDPHLFSMQRRVWLRRVPWTIWGILVAVLLPWYVFSWAYFGTLFPQSLNAKRVVYVVPDTQAITRFVQILATPFSQNYLLGFVGNVAGILLFPALALVGTYYVARRFPRLLPYFLYVWLYIAAFSLANPLMFRWYVMPVLPPYILAMLVGLWALVDSATAALKRPRIPAAMMAAVGIACVLFAVSAWKLHPDHGPDRPAPEMAWHKIELNYQSVAETLRAQYEVTSTTVVAAGDIGAIGYYSRAHILDTIGLVTPEISHYYPFDRQLLAEDANYAVPPAIILDYTPDYVVLMEDFVRNGLAVDSTFRALYAEVWFIPTDYYGKGMIVYQRRDLVPTAGVLPGGG